MYKVPQDVEAEDKFLGPLTFKQFLFGGGAAITGYLMFVLFTKGVAIVAFIFLPFFIFFVVLGFPWNREQPTDLWLTSRIRFILFPRKRIWDQSGIRNLVTITVPKREAHIYSDGLKRNQVESRLSALASVVDSRGWATKNLSSAEPDTDRLVAGNTTTLPGVNKAIVNKAEDMLDARTNPLAGQFDSMIKKSEDIHRQATLDMVDKALHTKQLEQPEAKQTKIKSPKIGKKKSENFWFLNQPEQQLDPNFARIKDTAVVRPGQSSSLTTKQKPTTQEPQIDKADEQKLLDKVHKKQEQDTKVNQLGRIKTIQPLSKQKTQKSSANPKNVSLPTVSEDNNSINNDANATSTTPVDPGILALAHNDDLNVETIARQAKKEDDNGEVVINLH